MGIQEEDVLIKGMLMSLNKGLAGKYSGSRCLRRHTYLGDTFPGNRPLSANKVVIMYVNKVGIHVQETQV